jgi:CBS domain-containing protein
MAIGDICNREVIIAERSLPVDEAARLMRSRHVGDLVVVEKMGTRNRPVGILTDRDLVVEVMAAGAMPGSLAVGDVMGPALVTVRENDGVFETIREMRVRGVRRMPVVDRDGGLVGIVTLDDVLALLAEEIGELAKLISREQQRETQRRT